MDGFRDYPSEFEPADAVETNASHDVAAAIGTDERRMHVRAYNYWVSLLDGRDFPSIEDLDSADVEDFASNSVLLDFTCGRDNPAIPYIGGEIREECGLDDDARTIADVPSRSLLSRLTDHYMQIIANRAPVGFEAEFMNQRGESICYRGILMPFSSDGDAIDFIYGVINWKTIGESTGGGPVFAASEEETDVLELDQEVAPILDEPAASEESVPPADELDAEPVPFMPEQREPSAWDGSPSEGLEPLEPEQPLESELIPHVPFAWEQEAIAEAEPDEVAELVLDDNAGLADRLWAARETAETVKAGEGRTRASLYRALSLAYDFAIAADQNPDDYAELLEESGVKAQARAPMTPIVKLVFGVDYDKARLTEFAAALSFAQRQGLQIGELNDFIEKYAGGLKGLVAAERQARRPEPKPDTRGEKARAKLRSAPAMSLGDIPADEEFAVVITRRSADGSHEAVAVVEDEALIDRAIRKAA